MNKIAVTPRSKAATKEGAKRSPRRREGHEGFRRVRCPHRL